MTGAAPPVTVVDPRGGPPVTTAAGRPPWRPVERFLALASAVVLAVAVAAASNLASRPPAPYADAVGNDVVLGDPGTFQVDVVLVGALPRTGSFSVTADGGWTVVGGPDELHDGVGFVFLHDSVCAGVQPPTRVTVRTGKEVLGLRVRHPQRFLRCDPADAVRVLTTSLRSGPQTTVELSLVNVATRDLHLTGFTYGGFRLTPSPSLPLLLPGRDAAQPLRLAGLRGSVVTLAADVADCRAAADALARAVATEAVDALPVTVDGEATSLTVKGLEVYLELLQRAACVR